MYLSLLFIFWSFHSQKLYMRSLSNKRGYHLIQAIISRAIVEPLQTSSTFEGKTGKVPFQSLFLWPVLRGKYSKQLCTTGPLSRPMSSSWNNVQGLFFFCCYRCCLWKIHQSICRKRCCIDSQRMVKNVQEESGKSCQKKKVCILCLYLRTVKGNSTFFIIFFLIFADAKRWRIWGSVAKLQAKKKILINIWFFCSLYVIVLRAISYNV